MDGQQESAVQEEQAKVARHGNVRLKIRSPPDRLAVEGPLEDKQTEKQTQNVDQKERNGQHLQLQLALVVNRARLTLRHPKAGDQRLQRPAK